MSTEPDTRARGRCECGAVAFSVRIRDAGVTICHCSQCRRTSGHVWASVHAEFADLEFLEDRGLTWFASSGWAQRGFCRMCGSNLFYRLKSEDGIAIAAGALDGPTGLHAKKHIFVADKGDYYDIADDVPQVEQY